MRIAARQMLPRRQLQASEASHAILGDQMAAYWLRGRGRLGCYPIDIARNRPALVIVSFSQIRSLRALLTRAIVFLLLFTMSAALHPGRGPSTLCAGVIGEDGLGFVLAKSIA
jgi:hypothetical protein